MRGRRIGLGVATLAMAYAVAGCGVGLQGLPKPGGPETGDTYPVHATFDDVLNLPIDAQVRDGSRIVGQIGSLSVEGYQADVELRIDHSYKIPVGTVAEVRFDNPLGDQYVELHRPAEASGDYLAAGDRLTLQDTSAAPTVEDTLGALATAINGGGIGNLQSIAHELNMMFDGNQPQIRHLLHTLDVAATDLAGGIDHVDDALVALEALTKQLDKGGDVLPKGLKSLSEAIGVLAGQNEQFDELIGGLAEFGKAGNEAIDKSGKQTVAAIKSLLPVVQDIVRANAKITPALTNLRTLEAQVPKVTEGGYLEASVTLPIAVSSQPSNARAARSLMTALGPLAPGQGGGAR